MRPTAHTRKETEPFAEELSNTNVPQLQEVYKAIFQEHCNGDIVYTLNDGALELYDRFDEAICQKLNDKWRNGTFLDNGTTEGGKERRLLLRLSVSLFVLYSYVRRHLFQSYGPVPRVVPEASMKYAINLIEYFQDQRREIDQILVDEHEKPQADNLLDKILRFPGPVCTITNLRAAASSKTRKEWTPALVKNAMETLASSQDDRMKVGEVVTLDRTIAFVKRSPESVTNDMLRKYTNITMEEYEQWFTLNDFNLPTGKRNSVIAKSRFSAEIQDFLNKEN